MSDIKKSLSVSVLVGLSILGSAGCRELSRQPGSSAYIFPSVAPDPSKPWYFPLNKPVGDYTQTPKWVIAQWGIPVDLNGSQAVAPGNSWSIANAYGAVQYNVSGANGQSYTIAQNGTGAALPCGTEYDLLLQPVGIDYPTAPQGSAPSKPLDQLANLGFRLGVTVNFEAIQQRCAAPLNYNYGRDFVAFVLSSTTGQTLFYQVQLRTVGRSGLPNMTWCPNNGDPATAHLFCVDDDISRVNSSLQDIATVGQRVQYATDMLPRLKQVLQSNFVRFDGSGEMIDGNIGHWRLTGLYFGSQVLGGANIRATFDSFCLIEQEPGDSTSNTVCTI
ncbi:MAG TPA: hypothetical protein VLC91_01015 [Spongiibacteraceae bacterium]|nr:hypothetical protein [Spongiibacteraceae bacterium]